MPDSSLVNLLRRAGFRGQGLTTAEAVLLAESRGNPRARNDNAGTGDDSYGLFQINMLGGMGPERRARYGLAGNDALYDPLTNAKVAFQMSKGGRDWSPWSTFKSGAYKKYLGAAVPDAPAGQQPQSRLAALAARSQPAAGRGLSEGQVAALLSARQAVGLQTSSPFLELLRSRMSVAPGIAKTPAGGMSEPTSAGVPGSKFLSVAANATLEGVDPRLVAAANALSRELGGGVTVSSGTRDRSKQSALYQRYLASGRNRAYIAAAPGTSNHEIRDGRPAEALDLLYRGTPIGRTSAANLLRKYGLNLSVPGDYPHVTLLGVRG